jgi:CHAT domain-containing protein
MFRLGRIVCVVVSLVVWAAAAGQEAATQVQQLVQQAEQSLRAGNEAEAIKAYKQALAIAGGQKDRQKAGEIRIDLAMLVEASDPEGSLAYAKAAQADFEAAKVLSWKAIAHLLAASACRSLGRHDAAAQEYVDAANTAQAVGLVNLEMEAVRGLGDLYGSTGGLQLAVQFYGRVFQLAEKAGDVPRQGAALMSLGGVFSQIGQYEVAQSYFERAAKALEPGNDRAAYAAALQNLGVALDQRGLTDQAKEKIEAALAIHKSNGDKAGEAGCLGTLGNIARDKKDFAAAEDLLSRSAALYRAAGDAVGEATALDSLGSLDYDQGRFNDAAVHFRRAVELAESAGAGQDAARSYGNLGEALFAADRVEESATAFYEAIARLEGVRTGLGSMTDAKAAFAARRAHVFQQYANALTLLGRPDEAFDVVQRLKARGLLDLMASNDIRLERGMTADELAAERALETKADRLNSQMIQEGVQNQEGAKARFQRLSAELRQTEADLAELRAAVYERVPKLRRQRMATTTDAVEFGRLMPEDTALVEYVVTDDAVVAIVVRKVDGVVTLTGHSQLVDREELGRFTKQLRDACASPTGDYKPVAEGLYATLVQPIERHLAGKARVVVCPDGYLWDIPFGVLLNENGRSLLDSHEIVYAYSATSAMAALAGSNERERAAKGLLVCANPAFGPASRFQGLALLEGQRPIDTPSRPIDQPSRPIDQPSRPIDQPSRPIDQPSRALDALSRAIDSLARDYSETGAIKSLPGTQREADALTKLFPGALALTGDAAQEKAVREAMADHRYLHFATHGFVNDASPMLSNVILAMPPKGAAEDGFLTAREIFATQLQAELTVLSACNTGRGEVRSGEGIVGLTWALFVAGCPSQIVSQWAVDDAATADLMVGLYERLAKGQHKGAALREAALALRATRSHPYYWAPFVLLGDWN